MCRWCGGGGTSVISAIEDLSVVVGFDGGDEPRGSVASQADTWSRRSWIVDSETPWSPVTTLRSSLLAKSLGSLPWQVTYSSVEHNRGMSRDSAQSQSWSVRPLGVVTTGILIEAEHQ